MLTLDSDDFRNLIHGSAALRGRGQFHEAIRLIEERLSDMAPDCYENAYVELIYAAREAGLRDIATRYATALALIDPNIPVVKDILGRK